MESQTLNQYPSLSYEDLKVINGGCGEDYICPEMAALAAALAALRML